MLLRRLVPVGLGLVAAASLASAQGGGNQPTPDPIQLVHANNELATDLYEKLAGEPGNLSISPLSIASALLMTHAGAKGKTADELAKALLVTTLADAPARSYPTILADLKTTSPDCKLEIANAVFGRKGLELTDAFQKTIETSFAGGIRAVDFEGNPDQAADTINGWVSEKTHGKIKEVLKKTPAVKDLHAVLVDTLYFKASWLHPFEKMFTKPAAFHGAREAQVPTMHQTGHFGYLEQEDAQVLGMPYKDGPFEMVVVLPKKKEGLAAIEKRLNPRALEVWTTQLEPKRVQVSLPRFKVTWGDDLVPVFQKLGVQALFTPGGADLSGITTKVPLYVSKIVHKTFVAVDEEGTEAAAVTSVEAMAGSAPPRDPPIVFAADHPFLFLIRDSKNGAVLFMGRVTDPEPAEK